MGYNFFANVSLKVRLAFMAMTMGAIAVPMALIMIFGRSEPMPRSAVFGCYAAAGAPSLDIREDAIHIIEPAGRTLSYVAEPSKTSYRLYVQPALALSPQTSGHYAFVGQTGVGFFWSLLPAAGRNRNRIRHPRNMQGSFRLSLGTGPRSSTPA